MEYSEPGENSAATLAPDLIEEAFGVDETTVVPSPRQYVEGPIVLGYN
ncbi:hypothetical protein [Amycolatopsis magusensis]|uniref:Uncharacterized protein n=1 Tax=Amycolatopsis magusensis TaxID=882444 RepID=A0ABS4PNU6_9PSEU|nr:hypothetical protein [Amycolatopsis magusensis]MBP2181086.1 hypothetical protein [Amycolatopsis magusensis]MDI5981810.1 hypothetical protein [Amycolatopsis magusensis]